MPVEERKGDPAVSLHRGLSHKGLTSRSGSRGCLPQAADLPEVSTVQPVTPAAATHGGGRGSVQVGRGTRLDLGSQRHQVPLDIPPFLFLKDSGVPLGSPQVLNTLSPLRRRPLGFPTTIHSLGSQCPPPRDWAPNSQGISVQEQRKAPLPWQPQGAACPPAFSPGHSGRQPPGGWAVPTWTRWGGLRGGVSKSTHPPTHTQARGLS